MRTENKIIRHGPAVLAMFQGHISRLSTDNTLEFLPDCTAYALLRKKKPFSFAFWLKLGFLLGFASWLVLAA